MRAAKDKDLTNDISMLRKKLIALYDYLDLEILTDQTIVRNRSKKK